MATVKKNNKKKFIVPICILLIAAIVLVSISAKNYTTYGQFKLVTDGEEVTLSTISTDSITESVSATGDVSAGATREYKVDAVADVKEVFVKVGDTVKKGDKLATFDTDSLDSQVESLQASYDDAKSAYNSAVKAQKTAKSNLSDVNSQISQLESKIAKLQKQQAAELTSTQTTKKSTTKKSTTKAASTTTKKTTAKQSTTSKTTKSNTTAAATTDSTTTTKSESTTTLNVTDAMQQISDSLTQIVENLEGITNDVHTMSVLMQVISDTVSEAIASGDYSADSISQKCGDAVAQAIQQGLIDETQLIVDSGVAVEMVEAAVASINWTKVAYEITNTSSVQLTSAQLQLAALYAEKEIFTVSADDTVVNAQKKVMNSSESALEVLKDAQAELDAGWTASMDGTITECDIAAGEQTTALQTAIKLENMDKMVATISLGEYDVHKVKVGMAATIKTAYGSYTGEVATIAPTATGGSEGSILDSVGSMAGVSGLSSLTSSGAGVECTVTIDDPDENIIIGFDADITIVTGSYTDVTAVPIESIVLEKDGTYVYLYDEEEGTVTKTAITTGAISDTKYEVTSGLKVGDKIVATPSSDYTEETFKVLVSTDKN